MCIRTEKMIEEMASPEHACHPPIELFIRKRRHLVVDEQEEEYECAELAVALIWGMVIGFVLSMVAIGVWFALVFSV